MRRRLFTIASALSLLLCAAACAMWARSYFASDGLHRRAPTAVYVQSERGRVVVEVIDHGPDVQPGAASRRGWDVTRYDPPTPADAAAWAAAPPPRGTTLHWRALGFEYLQGAPPVPGRVIDGAWTAPVWRVGVPYPFLVLAAAVLPAAWTWRTVRHRSRRRDGRCLACGYDLRATPGRCPECGAAAAHVSAQPTSDDIR